MEGPKENKEPKETSNPRDFNNRGPFKYLHHCQNNSDLVYSPTDIALESDFTFWTSQIKQILRRIGYLETENDKLRSKVSTR